ncbi:protein sprint [Copidosoma floridanum]|uniref:protein sprint n=1 Tax=Copidosoma floridanum TaxID=29053 RepID=UPI0006C967D9|nr:protein sprint [Copidosoma floridanum]
MLPPVVSNTNGEILTLYTSNNNESPGNHGNGRPPRGRYAEIGVRRSGVFLEPCLNHHHGGQPSGNGSHQASVTTPVQDNSPPPPTLDPHRRLTVVPRLHHGQSEGSLSSDNSGISAGSSSTEEDSGECNGAGGMRGGGDGVGNNGGGNDTGCNITLVERLIRSHPIWFLPGIQRAGAFHLLQGKEEGNFVVRQSSQSDTMALSVRLPAGRGPYIEHYLIQANKGRLSLETSENRFDNIPSLIAHYCSCCDELPVQLTLPRAMREAKNRQQLSSLALLGQEFWRYPMANPKPPESVSSSSNTSSLSSFHGGINNNNNNLGTPMTESIVLNLTPIIPKESQNTSPNNTITTSTFAPPGPRQPRPTPPNTLNLTTFNEPLESKCDINKLSPHDKLSQRLVSPNLVQNLVRSPSPVVHNVDTNVLSPPRDIKCEFVRGSHFTSSNTSITSNFHRNIATGFNDLNIKSPDVVQIGNHLLKSPPPPPPRWAKPAQLQNQKNINATSTVMLSVNQNGEMNNTVQSTPSDTPLLSPQSASSNKSLGSKSSSAQSSSAATPVLSSSSKLVSNGTRTPQVMSPSVLSSTGKSSRRRKERDARKNSQHYQESDILESYCRSSPADKISDYEDIWNTSDFPNRSAKENQNYNGEQTTRNHMNENKDRILSPGESKVIRAEQLVVQTNEKLIIRNDKTSANEKFSYKEITSPEFTSFKPPQESKSQETTPSPEDTRKRPDLLSRVCSANSLNSPLNLTPPRKFGLMAAVTRSESNSPMTPDSKHSSPFYAEPADAIPRPALSNVARRRPKPMNSVTSRFRHSEPGWLQAQLAGNCNHASALHSIDWDESEETEEKTPLISSSVDNLARRLSGREPKKGLPVAAKPVQPPKIKPKIFSDTSWAVDSSWEFIGNDADNCEPDYDCDTDCDVENVGGKFPDDEHDKYIIRNTLTAQSIILQRYPELLKSPDATESLYSDRNSSYDNVEKRQANHTSTMSTSSTATTTTVSSILTTTTAITTLDPRRPVTIVDRCNNYVPSESETILDTDAESDVDRIKRNRSCKLERLYSLLSPPRLNVLKRNGDNGSSAVGSTIRSYALQLAADKSTTFSQNIENFIQCTKESKEASPQVVMRNMRQFMSGMKNYLVKHGEREFEKEVEKERLKLKANEFLNLDHILEDVMMHLVVRPLREHVYRLFVENYMADGSIPMLADSIKLAQSKNMYDFGVQQKILPPTEASLERILKIMQTLQKADSPLEKLDNLLIAISTIYNSVRHANSNKMVIMGADDLLPLIIWILARGKFVDAEIESEFMWGLIHPSLLTGEGGYYLTTLSSAVQILKGLKSSQGTMSTINGCGTPDCSSVLRILVPDELHGSLNTRTLPVRPNMNTRDICRILAHKIRCTNPQDYGLFKLVQGEETLLGDQECPQDMLHCLFAYKRIDAKIAWPKTANPTTPTLNNGNHS